MYRGGGGNRGGSNPMGGGGGMARRLRSALDAADQDDLQGKVYDLRVVRRIPKYLAWVKKDIIMAATGTAMRTISNIALPYLVAMVTDNFIKTKNLSGLNIAVLVYLGFALLMWLGQYLETLFLV
jgi:hypothetical protein